MSMPKDQPPEPAAPPRFRVPRTASRRDKAIDRAAGITIRVFGVAVIAVVALILVFIVREIVPLFAPDRQEVRQAVTLAPAAGEDAVLAAGLDEFESLVYAVRADGSLEFRTFAAWDRPQRGRLALLGERRVTATYRAPSHDLLFLGTDDGHVLVVQATFATAFDPVTAARTITPAATELGLVELPTRAPVRRLFGRGSREGHVAFAAEQGEGELVAATVQARGFQRARASGGLLAYREEAEGPWAVHKVASVPGKIRAMALDSEANRFFVATDDGTLHQWYLHETRERPFAAYPDPGGRAAELGLAAPARDRRHVRALEVVIGDGSLLVGYDDGGLEAWLGVREAAADRLKRLRPVHVFERLPAPVAVLQASGRDKSFVAVAADGTAHLDYLTTERTMLAFRGPAAPVAVTYAPKLTGLLLVGPGGEAEVRALHNPHPEVSLRGLFGKVWYEGYDEPSYTWQSSSGSDEFEPKLSLVPLALGTLKGAFYGLLFAVPIAVFAALYASQLMAPRLRSVVKPAVEIMAALPSVVIGFLAGLWLAPALESRLTTLALAAVLVPVAVVLAAATWRLAPRRLRARVPDGMELWVLLPLVVATFAACLVLAPAVDAALFGGDVRQWLYDTFSAKVEQRNSIVIGVAMGFAVIPLIFTISEDAFSNVPRSFTSASLALGASRWQTAIRVVAPTASPGVFSAVMIGFGRAVGETMIVLMATGNTPILSFSPFNGMRTLSANIAVEIPEAPFGETHYRTLFLAALLLFLLTFAVNTIAEVVRQRLRQKYQAV